MSADAYKKSSQRKSIDGYFHDKNLSDDKHAVYHNPNTRKTVLAYRGTVISDPEDLAADAALSMGLHGMHRAFKNANNKYDQVLRKYGDRSGSNIHLTGHSLGGAKVHHVLNSRKTNSYGTTFNPGATPFTNMNDKAKNFTVLGDPISNSALGANTVVTRMKASNPHTIDNFTGGSINSSMVNGQEYSDYNSLIEPPNLHIPANIVDDNGYKRLTGQGLADLYLGVMGLAGHVAVKASKVAYRKGNEATKRVIDQEVQQGKQAVRDVANQALGAASQFMKPEHLKQVGKHAAIQFGKRILKETLHPTGGGFEYLSPEEKHDRMVGGFMDHMPSELLSWID